MLPFILGDRCTSVAYFGEEEIENLQRRARDPVTGETYLVGNISYEEWRKQIDNKYGENTLSKYHKMYNNTNTDKEQYNRYKNVLGKERIPSTFAKFQNLKYNNIEKWNNLKELYWQNNRTISLQNKLNYTLNGENNFIPTKAKINYVKTIAGKGSETEIRVVKNLINEYGGSEEQWSKRVGKIESSKYVFDVHWYELNGKQYEAKLKSRRDKK